MSESKPEVQPLEGKTSIDEKMFFEPERLSYRAAARLAAAIGAAAGPLVTGKTAIVTGTAFLVDLFNLRATSHELEILAEDYEAAAAADASGRAGDVREVGPRAVPAVAGAAIIPVVTTALGILSYFREDIDYRGIRTVVDPFAFELAVANELKAAGATEVFVVDLFVPTKKDSELAQHLSAVHEARAAVWQLMAPKVAELARLDGELDEAARRADQKKVDDLAARIGAVRRDIDPMTQTVSRLDRRLDDLEATLHRTDERTGLTTLARLLRAEAICASASGNARFVHAAIVSSGGHHRISRNLLRMMFLGDGLSFSGGAVARWAVVGPGGSIEKAGIRDLSLAGRFPSE
ncbi:MAG TPA: hypothetical protein VJ826_16405 [Candidatus Polarisedimenticolaceae bacterium]|nr:hypothetical protein [Candidatus Polarisedimenticolaceae bacterium]